MKPLCRFLLVRAGALALLGALACKSASTPTPPGETPPGQQEPTPRPQGTAMAPPLPVSYATVPPDFTGKILEQPAIDDFAWRSFIAVNWPASTSTCSADTSKNIIGGTGARVWETYTQDSDIFVASGKPAAWCNPSSLNATRLSQLPASIRELSEKTGVRRFMVRTAKARHSNIRLLAAAGGDNPNDIQEAVGGVLVDQNGRFVRYEVRVNQDEYNYLTTNNLYTKAGQSAVTIDFPVGPDTKNLCNKQPCGVTGSMELKAAWKVLGPNDDASRFYTIQAIVFNDDLNPPTPSPGTNPVTLGLVGLHIAHRTTSQQSWIWATFEHVDNTSRSFNNPKCPQTPVFTASAPVPCTQACCAPNTQTAAVDPATKTYEELGANGSPLHQPAQVVRVAPIEATKENAMYQALLAGTVWANYQLVSAQWAGNIGNPPIHPDYLANTTLETFNQGPVPPTDGKVPYPKPGYQPFSTDVSSSCMKCHSTAQTVGGANANFSFLLGNAQQ